MAVEVLMTGGTGFVGYWIKQRKPINCRLVALSHEDYEKGDWSSWHWDYVFHLANVSPERVLDLNFGRMLYCSSGAAEFREGEYADNKRKWEKECFDRSEDVVIARLWACIGAHLKNEFALTNFIDDATHGRDIVIKGSGNSVRSWIYGSEIGDQFWEILLRHSGIINVGSLHRYTLYGAASILAALFGVDIKVLNDPSFPDTIFAPKISFGSKIGLMEALEKTIHGDE